MVWMADQTRNTPNPATSNATPAMTASAVRAYCLTRTGPSAADARRRRGSCIKMSGASLAKVGVTRKMLAMRASPAVRRAQGPFVLPARTLLMASGLLAVALAAFNLGHELHSTNVDI